MHDAKNHNLNHPMEYQGKTTIIVFNWVVFYGSLVI